MTSAVSFSLSPYRGFTLFEVLVAIVIISIGLLGLLGLQTAAVVNTRNAQSRTLASMAVDSMADRIRANPASAAVAVYAGMTPANTAAFPTNCAQQTCSPAAMAAYDGVEWQQGLKQVLPAGQGFIDCAATSGGTCRVFTITIGWHTQATSDTTTPESIATCPSSAHAAAIDGFCFIAQVRP